MKKPIPLFNNKKELILFLNKEEKVFFAFNEELSLFLIFSDQFFKIDFYSASLFNKSLNNMNENHFNTIKNSYELNIENFIDFFNEMDFLTIEQKETLNKNKELFLTLYHKQKMNIHLVDTNNIKSLKI